MLHWEICIVDNIGKQKGKKMSPPHSGCHKKGKASGRKKEKVGKKETFKRKRKAITKEVKVLAEKISELRCDLRPPNKFSQKKNKERNEM